MSDRLNIAKKFASAIKSDFIERIILFGSVARGEDNEESDIDILIISDYFEEIDPIIVDEVFKIVLDDNELISPYVLSREQFEETKNFTFLTNVLREGVTRPHSSSA